MPESPSDDPFADLFGKLPDPRERQVRSTGEDAAGGSSASGAPATGPVSADGAPLSRRAAREAAARQATGSTPTTPAATAARAEAASQEPVPTAAGPALDESGLLAQPRVSASRPLPDEPAADDSWMFADGSAPALPYSRTGSTPQVGGASAAPAAAGRAAATATLEDLFTGATSTDELGAPPPPKNRRKRRIGGWIALGIVLVILGGIAAGGWYVWTTYEEQIREVMAGRSPRTTRRAWPTARSTSRSPPATPARRSRRASTRPA